MEVDHSPRGSSLIKEVDDLLGLDVEGLAGVLAEEFDGEDLGDFFALVLPFVAVRANDSCLRER